MVIPLSDEIRALLDGPNFAHLATLMPDGSPQSAPVWVGREGDRILICTGEGS
ncbi:MAG: pyridoxamine 5'-phosphate oxidase family protein, partial [Terriglobales bacterium]